MSTTWATEGNPSQDGISKGQVFYGWWVVSASFVISTICMGGLYSYGVFFMPVMTEFGWTRGLMSGVPLIAGLTYAATAPFTGWLADRFGFRTVTSVTALILSLGCLLSSQVSSIWQLYLFIGFMAGLGAPSAIALPMSMVARWFARRRGLALGVASAGIGAGTALVPPLTAYLIASQGWRLTYVFLGILIALTCIPLALVIIREPRPEYVLAIEGSDLETRTPSPGKDDDFSLSEALGTSSFWSLFAVLALCILGLGSTMTHIVPYAQDRGLSPVTAATLMSTLGVFSVIGRLAFGALADRVKTKIMLMAGITIQGLMMLWLIKSDTAWMLYLFAGSFGISYGGTFVLVPKLTSQIFGLKSMGAIFGALSAADGLGYGVGPLLAGCLFDATGRYDISFYIVASGMILGGMITFFMQERPIRRTKSGTPRINHDS